MKKFNPKGKIQALWKSIKKSNKKKKKDHLKSVFKDSPSMLTMLMLENSLMNVAPF